MSATDHENRTILVTGNLGYIGSVLVPMLRSRGHTVIGLDTGLYDDECCLYPEPVGPSRQLTVDVRDVARADLDGVDGVIHLAALSNDPLGELDPSVTESINLHATMRLASVAREVGVRRFVFASSQSIYGVADTSEPIDEDSGVVNPLTSYARTKWEAECALAEQNAADFVVVRLRPSTVFGSSPKLRCDIVFNNLVACAHSTSRIEIKSDGTPWRPVIHVRDVAQAFVAALEAPAECVAGEAFNVGRRDGNHTVLELAEAAQRVVPDCSLVFMGEHGADARTYRVGFEKIFDRLRDYFAPEWDLDRGGEELVGAFRRYGLDERAFRGGRFNRLARLRSLMDRNRLSRDLRWMS